MYLWMRHLVMYQITQMMRTDELKSHPFSVHFLIYFYLKRLIYVQKYGITHQTAMQQGIQEKEGFLQ